MPAASKISVPLINDCLFTVHPTPWLRLNTMTQHGYSYGYALPVPSDDFTFFQDMVGIEGKQSRMSNVF